MISPRLKELEALVKEGVGRIKRLSEENRVLKLELGRREAEVGELQLQLKRCKRLGDKHERLKTRIERLVQKLDRAGA